MRSIKAALWLGATAAVTMVAAAANASSMTYTFDTNLSGNNAANAATGGQFSVTVSDLGYNAETGANQVSFLVQNAAGGVDSSITRVYFEDGALLGIASVNNGSGVNYASPHDGGPFPGPNNPPAANNAPHSPFETTVDFLAKSTPEVEPNGVHPGQWVEIVFNLIDGQDYDDVIAAIDNGLAGNLDAISLRIAIHVQGFANGGSESFMIGGGNGTPIPLPAPVAMGLLGLVGVGLLRSRKTLRA